MMVSHRYDDEHHHYQRELTINPWPCPQSMANTAITAKDHDNDDDDDDDDDDDQHH